jgi:hypothetical protein
MSKGEPMLRLFSFFFLIPAAYAGADFVYYSNSGVCFNSDLQTGYNTEGDRTECRDQSEKVFVGKSFEKQNLQGCSFRAANLVRANFSGADLRGIDFTDANLKDATFTEALYDRFTKVDQDVNLKSKGAVYVDSGSSYEVGKAFRDLAIDVMDGKKAIAELDRFLLLNPSIDIDTEFRVINDSLDQKRARISDYLVSGHFEFFDLFVRRGFRFDLNFVHDPTGYGFDPTYLKAALASGRMDVLDYVLKYYGPYHFGRPHLTKTLKYLTPTTLDVLVQHFPSLLTDQPDPKALHDDPISECSDPKLLRRLLELKIPQNPEEAKYSVVHFLYNFDFDRDFAWLDTPLDFGFDFSGETFYNGMGSLLTRSWNKIPNLSTFMLELQKRAYSPLQPHGVRVLQSDELSKLSSFWGSFFSFHDTYVPDIKTAEALVSFIRTYLLTFGVVPHGEILKGFVDTPHPCFHWKKPEFEATLYRLFELDPNGNALPLLKCVLQAHDIYMQGDPRTKLPEQYDRILSFVLGHVTPEMISSDGIDTPYTALNAAVSDSRLSVNGWPFVKEVIKRLLALGADPNRGRFIDYLAREETGEHGEAFKIDQIDPTEFWSLLNSGPTKVNFNQTNQFSNFPHAVDFVIFLARVDKGLDTQKALALLSQYKAQIDWKLQVPGKYDGKMRSLLDFANEERPSKPLLDAITALVQP